MKRREFLAVTSAALIARAADSSSDEDAILKRIRPPKFAARDFDITKHGARGDGRPRQVNEMLCTDAIRQAIAACAAAGGGRVVIPRGDFLTGAIHLKSGVALHLDEGATLRFSRDPKHYLPAAFSRWEGTECWNYSPFLYALDQSNIAITGAGGPDGQADPEHSWAWQGQ